MPRGFLLRRFVLFLRGEKARLKKFRLLEVVGVGVTTGKKPGKEDAADDDFLVLFRFSDALDRERRLECSSALESTRSVPFGMRLIMVKLAGSSNETV